MRRSQSAAALRCIGLAFTIDTSQLTASLACQNKILATSNNCFKSKILSE